MVAKQLEAGQFALKVQVEVAALLGQRLLVKRLQVWVVLAEHATDPRQRPLLGVGQMGHDLDDGPLPNSGSPAQPSILDPVDQRPQHHRGRPQGLEDLLASVQHPPASSPARACPGIRLPSTHSSRPVPAATG
jgi:hypothetical protein